MSVLLFTLIPPIVWPPQSDEDWLNEVRAEQLLRELKDADWHVRYEAARELGTPGGNAKSAVPALLAAAADEMLPVRLKAIDALGQAGPAGAAAVPALIDIVRTKPWGRDHAGDALMLLGPRAGSALPVLTEMLRDKDHEVRWWAARVLGALRADAAPAVAPLTAALKDGEAGVREKTAEALAWIGPAAKPAAQALAALLADPEERVRRVAAIALEGLGRDGEAAMPVLVANMFRDRRYEVWIACTEAIDRLCPNSGHCVPPAIAALSDPDREVRVRAACWLQSLGKRAVPAVPALTAILTNDEEPDVRYQAICALGAIGPEAGPAVPALTEALKSPLREMRFAAKRALKTIRNEE